MGISEFFDFIYENNIDLQLIGNIEFGDDEIKWSYDALGDEYDTVNDHLSVVYEDDLDTLECFMDEHDLTEQFTILPPEFDDTTVSFLIVEE